MINIDRIVKKFKLEIFRVKLKNKNFIFLFIKLYITLPSLKISCSIIIFFFDIIENFYAHYTIIDLQERIIDVLFILIQYFISYLLFIITKS